MATRKRGKITNETTDFEFFMKAIEELSEFSEQYDPQEAIDLMCVMANFLQSRGYNIKQLLKKNIEHQLTRKD
jgi:predicted house-cleaning noncanonical NTP pyrophosphatase (MazG superfamily)